MIRTKFMKGITGYWWLPLLTGIVCLGIGIWAMLTPAEALPILATAFAIGLLAVGIFDGVWAFSTTKLNPGWGWDLCLAVIDIIAGVWMLTMSTGEMTLTFLYIVAIWMIFAAFNGIGQIFAVNVYNPVGTVLASILLICTFFLAFWIIFNPVELGITAWLWIGIALCVFGAFKISMAFRIRNYHKHLE